MTQRVNKYFLKNSICSEMPVQHFPLFPVMETLYLLSALVTVALIVASIFFLQKRKQDNKAEPVKEEEPPKKKSVPAQEPKKV